MARTTTGSGDTGCYPAPAASVARLFYDRVAATPRPRRSGIPAGAGWESVTWDRQPQTVRTVAAGLLALGIRPEERVAIASSTRIEWLYADLAIMCAGAATTTIYPSTGAEDVGFILTDSGTRLVFAEDDSPDRQAARRSVTTCPDVIRVVTFDGQADGEWVLSLADLQALGARHLADHPARSTRPWPPFGPEHLATLMYTSGTTGRPKGVELPHRCWTYVGAGAQAIDILSIDDLQYLWLPLSHSFGKMLEAVQLQIGFPTAVDGRMDKIVENLTYVRPTFMAGPPRIFEKVHSRVVQTIQEAGRRSSSRLFTWAFHVGNQVSRARLEGRRPGPVLRAQHALADRLVLIKVRRTGSAGGSASWSRAVPRCPRTSPRWFHAAGLLVLEGYGLTETSAAACLVRPEDPAFGVVGPPLIGTEVSIAPDGEILVRGPGVMCGYHHLPEATAEVLTARRLVRLRGHRRDRRRRAGADHRSQEGPDQDLRRQVHRPAAHRGHVPGGLPAGEPDARARRPTQLRHRADHPRP